MPKNKNIIIIIIIIFLEGLKIIIKKKNTYRGLLSSKDGSEQTLIKHLLYSIPILG